MKDARSLVYWGVTDRISSPGILAKVVDFVDAARDLGYQADYVTPHPGHKFEILKTLYTTALSSKTVIVYRYNSHLAIFFLCATVLARILGKKVIFDVPTPIIADLRFNILHQKLNIRSLLALFQALILGPLPFIASNLVVQYAEETRYLLPKIFTRSVLLGNGIRCAKWPVPKQRPHRSNFSEINLVGVATVNVWHRWEIVIEALNICRSVNPDLVIKFFVIGDGPDVSKLKNLSSKFKLEACVNFEGNKTYSELCDLYSLFDLGVGTFGWEDLGVKVASPLKYREYLANGLPFIYSTPDPDIDTEENIAFKLVPTAEAVAEFLLIFHKKVVASSYECRLYCEKNMDYSIKIPRILDLAD